jgi:hypothetical protein
VRSTLIRSLRIWRDKGWTCRPETARDRPGEQKANNAEYFYRMDEGRKRVLAIVAGILVSRHLKTTDDLFDTRDSPRTRSMVSAAVQWAKRIMGKADEEYGRKAKTLALPLPGHSSYLLLYNFLATIRFLPA